MTNRRNKKLESKTTPAADEAALWSAYTKMVTPLRGKTRVGRTSEDPAAETGKTMPRREAGHVGTTDSRETLSGKATRERNLPASPTPPKQRASHTVQSTGTAQRRQTNPVMDPRVAKRLARGRTKVGARLDLHGLRQEEAYVTLKRFLISAQNRDLRTVLVITGKGQPDIALEPWHRSLEEQRGVLRRALPNWLRQPEFTRIVVGFGPAHVRDGGEGAYYVQLRRRDK
ncbi:MAG: Smr/MutS family protein [Hyphomicrobiaceae bacterium]